MSKITVNILSSINKSSKITKETIDNKEHYIIRDVVPIVDDVVMNGGLYPSDEISKGYMSINGNLMPLGHPKVGGQYVSASNAKAINEYYGGAWAENVRKESGKVLLDAYVDIEFARNHEKGKLLLERLESMVNGEDVSPIHVSTGLILNKIQKTGKSKGKSYSWVATNMMFDHVAILLNEQGAATPEEGVGIFVNSDGEHKIETANLIDASNCTQNGVLNKFKAFFCGNSDLSFADMHQLLADKLNGNKLLGDDQWRYIDSVYPSFFIYDSKDGQFKQSYLIDENQKVNFVGEAVEVKKTVIYDEIKTNGEDKAMKDKILQALNAKGIKTDGLTDEQLLTAFNEQVAKEALEKKEEGEKKKKDAADKKSKDEAQNSDQTPEWFKNFENRFSKLEQAVNKSVETEVNTMREAVKTKFGMTDTAVNALTGEPLIALYAECQKSVSVNGAFGQTNSNQSICDMPE